MGSLLRTTGVFVATAFMLGACGSDSKSTTTAATASASSTSVVQATTAASVDTTPTTGSANTAGSTTEPSPTTPATAIETTTTAASVDLSAGVCALVTPDMVTAVLGAPSTDAGTEQVFEPTYKGCRWLTAAGTGNVNALNVSVLVRKSSTDQGFAPSADIGNPVAVTGVGDSATYSNNGQTVFEVAELVASEGLVALAIDLNYGGTTPHSADLQGTITEIARQIFSQLNG